MADLFEGKSGQVYVRLPGNRYEPVTHDQASFIHENGLEAFANSASNSVQQLSQGVSSLLTGEVRPELQALRREQEARQIGNPGAAFAGSVAPDVAIGAATMGTGGLASQVARAGLTEAAIGAARNPENPLAGAAIQGAAGAVAGGIGAGFVRGANVASGVIRGNRVRNVPNKVDSLSAARNLDPDFAAGERQLRGLPTAEKAERAGFNLTRNEATALNSTSRETLDAAVRGIDRDEVVSSTNVFGPLKVGDVPGSRYTRADHQKSFTDFIAKEVGEDNVETFTRVRMGDMLKEQQEVFKDLIDKAPVSIRADEPLTEGGDTFLDIMQNAAADAPVNAERQVQRLLEQVEEAISRGDGTIRPKDFRTLHKEVSDSVRRNLSGDSGNRELGFAMAQVKTALDDAAERVVTQFKPRAAGQIREARKNYGIIMAAMKGKASNPDGLLNPSTFKANYARYHPGYARGKTDNDFTEMLDLAVWLTQKRTPDSGTAARLIGAMGQQMPTIGGTSAALGGLGGLLSE